MQLWGVASGAVQLLDSIPCGDSVTAAACFAAEPFALLGCESGAVQVLGLTGPAGGVLQGVGAASSTSLMPYQRVLPYLACVHMCVHVTLGDSTECIVWLSLDG